MYIKRWIALLLAGTGMFMALPCSAQVYGPEGLFGGRPNPDATYNFSFPAETETQPARGETVLQHPRPDYTPQPLSIGSFNFYPSLETGAAYNSNIYATNSGKVSDTIFDARPMLLANSDWDRNALSIITFGDLNFYDQHPSQNFDDAVAEAEGRIDIAEQTWLLVRGGYQHLYEPRNSPDNVNGSEPTPFDVYSAGVSAYRGAGLINARIDYDIRHLDYDNTPSSLGVIDTSMESRTEQVTKAKFGYDLTENIKPYVQVSYNTRNYDNDPTRQSQGYDAVIGADTDLGGIVQLGAYTGWIEQDYYNFGPSEINDGIDFGGKLVWNITGLTTFILDASRSIEETPFSTYDSFMATGGSVTLTHELLRNLLVEADASYSHDNFQGFSSNTENDYNAGGGLRWLINQNLYTDLVYNREDRTSPISIYSFDQNIVCIRLGIRL